MVARAQADWERFELRVERMKALDPTSKPPPDSAEQAKRLQARLANAQRLAAAAQANLAASAPPKKEDW